MIDLFSEGITIKVKKEPKVKTNVGCVLSLTLIILVLIYAIFALVNMTKRNVVFTTFSTQFAKSLNDSSLGTLSKSAVPLEAAHIISNISWYDSSNQLLSTAQFGNTDFSVTSWANYDFSCSSEMQKNLIKQGYDVNNAICIKLDNYYNSTQIETYTKLTRGSDDFGYYLLKVCRLTPKLELDNYEQPYNWALICQDYPWDTMFKNAVPILYSAYNVMFVSLETDDNYFGTSSKREYVRYLDVYQDYSASSGISNSFSTTYYFSPKFDNISRKFQKITDVIASINGIYGLLLLVLIIFGKSCVDLEQKARLFRYLSSKKDLGLKDSNITTWDIFNARLFKNKQAIEKVNEMERFYVANIEDKLELSNIANFEGPVVIMNSPKSAEEKDKLNP